MTVQIALLRAVNLGSSRRIAMADLRALATDLGFTDAKTVLQSGNLVYRTTMTAARAEGAIEAELRARAKLDTSVMIRTAAEWEKVIQRNPFPKEARSDPAHLVVIACKKAPGKNLKISGAKREIVRAIGKEVYVVYPDGIGVSRLKVDVNGTARNWNTVMKLSAATQF
jgi:uncharacterized protein (DUF1697 family)